MQLQPKKTYKNKEGGTVHIVGLAKREKVEGKVVYWSIQGDHYTEDGRFIHCRRNSEGLEFFTIDDDWRALEEDTPGLSQNFWE